MNPIRGAMSHTRRKLRTMGFDVTSLLGVGYMLVKGK